LLKALAAEDGRVCCDYDGARLALEDGAYLASINADQEVVENLHAVLVAFERTESLR
jgi:hypothetical protein